MIFLYRILTVALYPFLILLIYFRIFLNKEDKKRFKEKIFSSKFNVKKNEKNFLIWFHAASIGELKSILPIIEELNKKNLNYEFLITTVTLSSGNLANEKLRKFKNVCHRYFPLDTEFLIKKFLKSWKPKAIFLVESEIWPNLILNAKKLNIPIAIINARITNRSFKKWTVFSKASQKIFNSFDLALVSNTETEEYLKKLNVKNIFYTGNIKILEKPKISLNKNFEDKILEKKRFWLAVSTHEGEEKFCLKTHIQLKENFKDIITIIAPRHINRVKKISNLCEKLKLNTQILEKEDSIKSGKEIIIVNSFGILSRFFSRSTSVLMGKSILKKFRDVGGQNPLEAARYGCKIYHGPYVYNFSEIYEILNKNNISKLINTIEELSYNLKIDLNDFKKNEKSLSFLDVLEKSTMNTIIGKIEFFLNNANK